MRRPVASDDCHSFGGLAAQIVGSWIWTTQPVFLKKHFVEIQEKMDIQFTWKLVAFVFSKLPTYTSSNCSIDH